MKARGETKGACAGWAVGEQTVPLGVGLGGDLRAPCPGLQIGGDNGSGDPGLSFRLTEWPVLACVSLGKGSVIYDGSFDLFKEIGHLCRLCKAIAGNAELVKPGGAQCLPSGVWGSQVL